MDELSKQYEKVVEIQFNSRHSTNW